MKKKEPIFDKHDGKTGSRPKKQDLMGEAIDEWLDEKIPTEEDLEA